MSLTDEIGTVLAENNRLKHDNESLKARLAKQAGALEESRAQNRELIGRNEKFAAQLARIDKHLRDTLGSAEHIVKAAAELAPVLPEAINPIPTIKVAERHLPNKLRDKINGLLAGAAA